MPRRSSHRSLESRLTDQTKLLVNAASAAVFNAPTGVGADGDAGAGLRRHCCRPNWMTLERTDGEDLRNQPSPRRIDYRVR
jgi:hypothetical protein